MRPSNAYKKVAKSLNKLLHSLWDNSEESIAGELSKNAHGGFWLQGTVDEVIALFREVIELAPSQDESNSDRFALAGFLSEALRLDEAAVECETLISLRPDKCFADQSLLAQIEARRGNLERALSLADMVNSNPRAIMFRVDEAVLRVEAEKAARRIPRRQDRGQV